MRDLIFVMSLVGAILSSMRRQGVVLLTSSMLALLGSNVGAAIRFVNHANPSPEPPYANWASAATNIQDAIDAAGFRDQILVTNGVYRFGGRTAESAQSNRVALVKEVTVSSINGPDVTLIEGALGENGTGEVWGGNVIPWGSNSVRCAYVGSNCVLSGFTLTNGYTIYGGAAGGVLSADSGTVSNCLLVGNSAYMAGGGAVGGRVYNCSLARNRAIWGGGVWASRIFNSVITNNYAFENGGGANSAELYNCTVIGNSANEYAGGVWDCRVFNSIVYFNDPGGNYYTYSYGSFDFSCTSPLPSRGTGNINADPQILSGFQISSGSACRGAARTNYVFGTDVEGEPWRNPPSMGCDEPYPLSVAFFISYTNVAVGFNVDLITMLDGEVESSVWDFGDGTRMTNTPYASHAWVLPGDYEVVLTAYNVGKVRGVSASATVHVAEQSVYYVSLSSTNPIAPYVSWEKAATNIQDAVDVAVIGATVLVTNGIYDTGGRAVWGLLTNRLVIDKPVKVQSVNGPEATVIKGYQVPGTIRGDEAIRGVYMVPGSALSGFTVSHCATRDSEMSDGFTERSGGGIYCESSGASVSNCVLVLNSAANWGGGAYSGTLINCLISNNSAMLLGGGVCAATLSGCNISGNWVQNFGGGVQYCVLTNCILTGNTAETEAGGGAQASALFNCLLSGNSAAKGGGAHDSGLINCTVTGNTSSGAGGGVGDCGLVYNSIVYGNQAKEDANYVRSDIRFSCVLPLPEGRLGNITNAPLFVDALGRDFRLQSNSPCINAGDNSLVTTGTDLERNLRVIGATIDMGGYEYTSPRSLISYAWLQRYGLAFDGSADGIDSDSDGMDNWQEWRSGTDGTNALSVLKILSASNSVSGVTVSWRSVGTRTYYLQSSTNLVEGGFVTIESNIVGHADTTVFIDYAATNGGPYFYRVGVQ